jgi:hypothetical protein
MKKINAIYVFLLFFGVFHSFGAEKEEFENALKKAIQFSATPETIKEAALKMETQMRPAIVKYLKSKLGTNNLSSFILTMSPLDREDHKIEALSNKNPIPIAIKIMKQGKSLVQLEDLIDLKWKKSNDNEMQGSFTYYKKDFYKIKCLFKGKKSNKKWEITKLSIPPTKAKLKSIDIISKSKKEK